MQRGLSTVKTALSWSSVIFFSVMVSAKIFKVAKRVAGIRIRSKIPRVHSFQKFKEARFQLGPVALPFLFLIKGASSLEAQACLFPFFEHALAAVHLLKAQNQGAHPLGAFQKPSGGDQVEGKLKPLPFTDAPGQCFGLAGFMIQAHAVRAD